MKKIFLVIILAHLISNNLNAQVANTSYVTQYGEKVLQLSIIVPINIKETWKLFTTDEGLKKWIAPVAKIDMKIGGSIRTNYAENKTVDDTTSIKLDIINYIEYEMLTLKVNLNNSFPPEAKKEDKNLQEILQFVKVDDNKTKIISTMVGWGQGSHWDKAYSFFEKGNDWTYKQILKLF
ncbi:MAG: SRPBCC domain-containing protein [Parafilimonas sp.]|nr:SRPBCC domain-containing protein [Parafilimonas sp.]